MKLKDLYIDYFISKGHKQIPSAGVVPENDASVLFNTAGMQPLIPYLMGKTHPYGTRLVNYQKCIRTNDLEEVGNKTHHTFFEMLGNWSLGDYFKEESISYSFELLTKVLKIPLERLAFTVFEGEGNIPRDDFSAEVWRKLGVPDERIAYLGVQDNFWIAGETGPCGPDTEIFYWRSEEPAPTKFDPEDKNWVEIWNNVFMEFYKDEEGNITELPNKNVDTGMGLERTVAVLEGKTDNYTSSVWVDVIEKIEEITKLPYQGNETSMRIIADHIRTATFVIADPAGIKPSNTDQGYVLRRLIRRAIRHAKKLGIDISSNWDSQISELIISKYNRYYSELNDNKQIVLEELEKEKIKFNKTLEKGLREFEKACSLLNIAEGECLINAETAFRLYDTYGFPIELTDEVAKEKGMNVDIEGFKQKFKEHQEKSRAGAENKFKGGMASNSEAETKLHTATHLLNAALKQVVDKNIRQRGSNITSERLRFDFNSDRKITNEELRKIEEVVNNWITEGLVIEAKDMSKKVAIDSGAECMFIERYPDVVSVYCIGDISSELCGGPHAENTKELGKFRITKEEASSAGIRRIKAVLE